MNHIYFISRGLNVPKKVEPTDPISIREKFKKSRHAQRENRLIEKQVKEALYEEYKYESSVIQGFLLSNGKEPEYASIPTKPHEALSILSNRSQIYNSEWKLDANLNPHLLPKPIIFIHNPKTAGTTLKKILLKNVDISRYFHKDAHPTPSEIPVVLESTFIFGHMKFGLHYHFEQYYKNPNASITVLTREVQDRDDKMTPYSYLAVFREPVERVYSHYFFLKEHIDHPLHSQTMRLPFQKWVERSPIAHNEMCRRLVGITREDSTPDDFQQQCLHRLKHDIKFVGLTERFNETLVLMSHYLGFQDIHSTSENIGHVKNEYILTDEDREFIANYNSADVALYNEAKLIFEKQIDSVGREFFEKELQIYNEYQESISSFK
ncbi:hypothetical protein DLAC_01470 [Tieghemostelium lacteum]|uniref:Sulfotransferase family protein n=1 Tax=Tieghemostelium lacteum TaxID=361077 RepID=A0A152A5H4_TIELA|nr:hypothetical protein DLAC_01470 [Tieghemostelium lacteum]|eukprot:KYR01484.1 hypothetical protein DLAC_01470 [Tieghemostelium lacteum]